MIALGAHARMLCRLLAVAATIGLQVLPAARAAGPAYDIAILHARAIDPETGLDAIRNIGIIGDKVTAVSTEALLGKETIEAQGLVASPGFIDLHSHAYGYETATYQAMDGVTTRLELEIGVYPVKPWYDKKAGH